MSRDQTFAGIAQPKTYSLADAITDAWNKSALGKFVDYQVNPENYLKPNERLLPGPMENFQYTLQPGERQEFWDDGTKYFGPDGQQLSFQPPPTTRTLADYMGYMLGGAAGAPKGAVGAGIYRRAFDPGPSLLREDPTAVRDLALKMEAMHKRGAQGYDVTSFDPKDLAKVDKSLTRVSNTEPLPKYVDRAERAMDMGFDTPAFHVTNATPDPDALKKLAGSPWFELDPTIQSRGAFYLGDFNNPTAPITTGAAQGTYGGAKIYPFLVKDVFGEHPMPPGLFQQMPDTLAIDKWQQLTMPALEDAMAAMRSTPGYADNMAGVTEGMKEFYGKSFDPSYFASGQHEAQGDVAKMIAQLYYKRPEPHADILQKIDPFEFKAAHASDTSVPGFSSFESGAKQNTSAGFRTGLHSPIQNELGALGFAGSRVFDEMRKVGGKSYAMFDPTGVRAVGAKFKDPMGDLLSGQAPPGWWLSLMDKQAQEPQQ